MIEKEFNIDDLNLKYFVGINQINIDLKKILEKIELKGKTDAIKIKIVIDLIERIQSEYEGSMVQFFSDKYVLNRDHIYIACYNFLKAFNNKENISNRQNIEFLLYLSTKRQIKKAIEAFGIKNADLESGKLNYCIVSRKSNMSEINGAILQNLEAHEVEFTIDLQDVNKINQIKTYFKISNNQIKSVFNSYGIKIHDDAPTTENLDSIVLALSDLICEKMALLSLEKIKTD